MSHLVSEPWIHVLGTNIVGPDSEISIGNLTLVPYRPAALKVSAKRSALLSIEMRRGNGGSEEIFPLGMIDLWSRYPAMRPTCSIFDVRNVGMLTSHDRLRIVVKNHGRFKARVYAEIEGIRQVER